MTLVSEVMNRFPLAVEPESTLAEARARARASGASHVLVVEEENLVGILCACDLCAGEAGERVCDRMSVPVLTVRPDATLEEAAEIMTECAVHCLPVALGGLLLGTVGEDALVAAGLAASGHHREAAGQAPGA